MTSTVAQTIPLSPIDDAQPCGFVRTILAFPSSGSDDALRNDLERGLSAIISRWPHLKGQLVPRDGANPRGRFMVHMSPSNSVKVTIKHLTTAQFPYSYKELTTLRVPIAALKEDLLCDVPSPAVPGPALIIQANLITGDGLLLSICLHHCVVDGEGTRLIIEEFARGCRTPYPIVQPTCPVAQTVNFRESTKAVGMHPVYKSYHEADDSIPPMSRISPPAMDPDSPEPSVSSETSEDEDGYWHDEDNEKTNLLLTFSAAKLKNLRSLIWEALGEETIIQTFVKRLSTNDCLASLLWQGITRARSPDLTSKESSFFMAVDSTLR